MGHINIMEKLVDKSLAIEVLHEKIGRNVLLFQKLELMLKAMIAASELSGRADDLVRIRARRKERVLRLTLGMIVGKHIKTFNQLIDDEEPPDLAASKLPYFRFHHSIECEEHVLGKRKSVLKGLVDERNDLIHLLGIHYDLDDHAHLAKLDAMLEDQHRRLSEEVAITKEFGEHQFESQREAAAFLMSAEGKDFFARGIIPAWAASAVGEEPTSLHLATRRLDAPQYRSLILADYDAVIDLWKRSEGVRLRDSDSREGIDAYLARNPGLSFVAETAGKIVGTIMAGHDGKRGYIQHLSVDGPHRRQGIGRKLVTLCLDALKGGGILKSHLMILEDNEAGKQFWYNLGWNERSDIELYSFIHGGGHNT